MDFCQDTYSTCFSFLSEDTAKNIFNYLETRTFESGEKLSPLFCFVVSGALDVRREVKTGGISRAHALARIGVGSFVGEGVLLDKSESFCTIVAVEATSVVTMSKKQFEDFLFEYPSTGCLFLKKLLTNVHQRLGNSSARLAHVL